MMVGMAIWTKALSGGERAPGEVVHEGTIRTTDPAE